MHQRASLVKRSLGLNEKPIAIDEPTICTHFVHRLGSCSPDHELNETLKKQAARTRGPSRLRRMTHLPEPDSIQPRSMDPSQACACGGVGCVAASAGPVSGAASAAATKRDQTTQGQDARGGRGRDDRTDADVHVLSVEVVIEPDQRNVLLTETDEGADLQASGERG